MKTLLSTALLNLGMKKKSANVDQLVLKSKKKESVDAAMPSCLPTL